MIYTKALKQCKAPIFVVPEIAVQKPTEAHIGNTEKCIVNKIKIIGSKAPKYSKSTLQLASDMFRDNGAINDFTKTLRKTAHSDDKSFQFNMISKSAAECKSVVDIAFRMYGLLYDLNWKNETKILSGKVQNLPKAIRFLCGEYLEVAAYEIACSVVERFSIEKNLTWTVHPNVIVTDGFTTNEFDLLIEITDKDNAVHSFIVEMKSGNAFGIDLGKMRSIGERYGVLPDRMMLVTSSCYREICSQMEDFVDFYIATSEDFACKLTEMLNKKLGGK